MTPFTITDVGTILGIERLPGGDEASYNVVCPFCGDRRGKCNFVVYKEGEMANIYHCFHCDAAGNMLTLYADLTGLYGTERYNCLLYTSCLESDIRIICFDVGRKKIMRQ